MSNVVENNIRKVKLTRSSSETNTDYYTFTKDKANIPILLALGSTPTFGYHKVRGTNSLYLNSIRENIITTDTAKKYFGKGEVA